MGKSGNPHGRPVGHTKTVSPRAHKAVHALYARIRAGKIRVAHVAAEAGVCDTAMCSWRSGTHQPHVSTLEAALNSVGMTLVAVPL